MRILVTGASGFIGRRLANCLNAAGHDVVLLLRERFGMGARWPETLLPLRPDVQAVYADLRNFRLTSRAMAEAAPEAVYHLAAAGVTDPFLPIDNAIRNNIYGTINLVRACFERSTSTAPARFVVARTPGERSALNAYATSKAAAWEFCRMFALTREWPICGAMIFQAYGPGQPEHTLIPSALGAALAGQDFPMTSGVQLRDWIYLDDVISGLEAVCRADLSPGSSVDLGTGRAISVLEVVKRIYVLVGRGGKPLPSRLPQRPGQDEPQIARVGETDRLIKWRSTVSLEVGLEQLASSAMR